MAQESYADYSIIHKYFQQEKLHEEDLSRYKDQIEQLTEEAGSLRAELDVAKARIRELMEKSQNLEQAVVERDNDIHRLNSTIGNLNQKIAAMTRSGR